MRLRPTAVRIVRSLGLQPAVHRVRAMRPGMARDRRDNEHFRVALATCMPADGCCVDIGANVGSMLAHMVRVAPAGQHVAFEPVPWLAAQLRSTFPTVDVREVALSDHTGVARFAVSRSSVGLSTLKPAGLADPNDVDFIDVAVERLDDALAGYEPTFMKIDVEGGEYDLLRGAERVLSDHHPILWLEHGTNVAEKIGVDSRALHDLLVGHGYRIFDADGNGPIGRAEFDTRTLGVWTYLAR